MKLLFPKSLRKWGYHKMPKREKNAENEHHHHRHHGPEAVSDPLHMQLTMVARATERAQVGKLRRTWTLRGGRCWACS